MLNLWTGVGSSAEIWCIIYRLSHFNDRLALIEEAYKRDIPIAFCHTRLGEWLIRVYDPKTDGVNDPKEGIEEPFKRHTMSSALGNEFFVLPSNSLEWFSASDIDAVHGNVKGKLPEQADPSSLHSALTTWAQAVGNLRQNHVLSGTPRKRTFL